jgi:hypothetical protein
MVEAGLAISLLFFGLRHFHLLPVEGECGILGAVWFDTSSGDDTVKALRRYLERGIILKDGFLFAEGRLYQKHDHGMLSCGHNQMYNQKW